MWCVGLFPIVQTSIDGRGYSSTNKAAWKSFDVEVWWACLRFIVSCVFPFEWPTRMTDKESTTKRTAQGNEMVGLDGSSSRQQCWTGTTHNAPLDIRYPPDIRPRPLPGLIFSNIRPRSVTNWISTCGLNRFATCSLRSAECHRVKPTANLVCVIGEVTGAQLVTAAQHTLRRVGSL